MFKLVLLGEGRTGKTSLLTRYAKGGFDDKQNSTTRASFLEKDLMIGRQPVRLSIWDTAGQERYHALGPIYYRDAHGALLVFDLTDRDSLVKVQNWIKELRVGAPSGIVCAIAANKADLKAARQVSDEEIASFAASVGAIHMLTSAKNGLNVEEIFMQLATEVLKKNSVGASASQTGRLLVSDDISPVARSSGCC